MTFHLTISPTGLLLLKEMKSKFLLCNGDAHKLPTNLCIRYIGLGSRRVVACSSIWRLIYLDVIKKGDAMKPKLAKYVMAATAVAAFGMAKPTFAYTTYSYTGNNFTTITDDIWLPVPGSYTTAMNVSGWFETISPLAANVSDAFVNTVAWSFTDGRSTYNSTDSVLSTPSSFSVWTDNAGNIVKWSIGVERLGTGNLWTINSPSLVVDYGAVEPNPYNSTTQRDNASVYNNAGMWVVTAPVPEPETYAMMLAGLGLLGVMKRRRKQKLNA